MDQSRWALNLGSSAGHADVLPLCYGLSPNPLFFPGVLRLNQEVTSSQTAIHTSSISMLEATSQELPWRHKSMRFLILGSWV